MFFRNFKIIFICASFIIYTNNSFCFTESEKCIQKIKETERTYNIPSGTLHIISLVESGKRDDDGKLKPWPWTVCVNGRGIVFKTKKAAAAKVRSLMSMGIKNIDAGCMQVNLHYHGHNFKSIEDALDPDSNIEFAAQLLQELRSNSRSWTAAVAKYHSCTKCHADEYLQKYFAIASRLKNTKYDDMYRSSIKPSHKKGRNTKRSNNMMSRFNVAMSYFRSKPAKSYD